MWWNSSTSLRFRIRRSHSSSTERARPRLAPALSTTIVPETSFPPFPIFTGFSTPPFVQGLNQTLRGIVWMETASSIPSQRTPTLSAPRFAQDLYLKGPKPRPSMFRPQNSSASSATNYRIGFVRVPCSHPSRRPRSGTHPVCCHQTQFPLLLPSSLMLVTLLLGRPTRTCCLWMLAF